MRFRDSALQAALSEWRADGDIERRAQADNFWFEERVNDARRAVFEERASGTTDASQLRRRQVDYFKEKVSVDEDVPDTFDGAFLPVDLSEVDETENIIRVEKLLRPLAMNGMSFAQLADAVVNNETALVEGFISKWNQSSLRDWRPVFAAFEGSLSDDLPPNDGWAGRLRDRLGLAHFHEPSLPVALMRYTVAEVREAAQAAGAAAAMTTPTVLDGEPWPHFFPAPGELDYGRAMPLFKVDDDSQLVAEILHFRIEYKRKHLIALDKIAVPPAAQDLKALRNHHLMAIRLASDRYDFGEEIS